MIIEQWFNVLENIPDKDELVTIFTTKGRKLPATWGGNFWVTDYGLDPKEQVLAWKR